MEVSHIADKRWFAGGSIGEASLEPLGRHLILVFSAGGRRYRVPLTRCSCDPRHVVDVDGKEYCEAEYCREFIEDLAAGKLEEFYTVGSVPRPLSDPRPLREDTTNPLAVYRGAGSLHVIKGYREDSRHNYEPFFYEYLQGRWVTPPFNAYYLYRGSPLGLVTTYVEGVDGGQPFYRSLVDLLGGRGLHPPRREAGLATESLSELHSAMMHCSGGWCGRRPASGEDVEEWARRVEFYLSHIEAEGLEERAREAAEAMERFRGKPIIRIHQDLHLSQYLYSGGRYLIVDFEGEPGRPERWRGILEPPVRDFASLLRSLSYIAFFALKESLGTDMEETAEAILEGRDEAAVAANWARGVARMLGEEYLRRGGGAITGAGGVEELLELAEPWLVERGLYEVYYEEHFRGGYAVVAASTLAARIPL